MASNWAAPAARGCGAVACGGSGRGVLRAGSVSVGWHRPRPRPRPRPPRLAGRGAGGATAVVVVASSTVGGAAAVGGAVGCGLKAVRACSS